MRRNLQVVLFNRIVIIIIINILSYLLFFRFDFTESHQYSLSKVSKNITKENVIPIHIDYYVSKNLPLNIKERSDQFLFLLREYQSISKVDFEINIVNVESPDLIKKLEKINIYPQLIERRNRIHKVYMGARLVMGSNVLVMPQILAKTPIEYEITRMIKQSSNPSKPNVGLIYGHGEINIDNMSKFIANLAQVTSIKIVSLLDDINDLMENRVLCIIGPVRDFSPSELEVLKDYLSKGGKLFVALNSAGSLYSKSNNLFYNKTGISSLLEGMGLKVNSDVIIDNNCGEYIAAKKISYLSYGKFETKSPYLPNIINFSDNIITKGLHSMQLVFTSSILQVKTETSYVFHSLARSSAISGIKKLPLFKFNLSEGFSRTDFNHPNNIVAAYLTNEDDNSAIVAITNADFIRDGVVEYSGDDNISFALNSIEWLADNSGLIQLRNKFTTFPIIEPLSENRKSFLAYLNTFLPIILIVLFALTMYFRDMRKRSRRANN